MPFLGKNTGILSKKIPLNHPCTSENVFCSFMCRDGRIGNRAIGL